MTALITSQQGHRYASFRERRECESQGQVHGRWLSERCQRAAICLRVDVGVCWRLLHRRCSTTVAVLARTGEMFSNLQKAETPSTYILLYTKLSHSTFWEVQAITSHSSPNIFNEENWWQTEGWCCRSALKPYSWNELWKIVAKCAS